MKSCDEMVNSLLERRAVYEAEKARKKKNAMRTATALCSFCLVAVLGIAVNKSGLLDLSPSAVQDNNPLTTLGTAEAKGNEDKTSESSQKTERNTELKYETTYYAEVETQATSKPNNTNGNRINLQPITGALPANKMNIFLSVDDFVIMSREEMIEYYGVDYFPNLPADIKPWEENEPSGIYRRNGGTGELYWDTDILNFSNDDFTREVNLEIAKGHLPFCDYLQFKGTEKMSVINGTDVYIGLTDNGYYYTEFMYKDAGIRIVANGVSEEEFVSIITSIIE